MPPADYHHRQKANRLCEIGEPSGQQNGRIESRGPSRQHRSPAANSRMKALCRVASTAAASINSSSQSSSRPHALQGACLMAKGPPFPITAYRTVIQNDGSYGVKITKLHQQPRVMNRFWSAAEGTPGLRQSKSGPHRITAGLLTACCRLACSYPA